MLKKPTPRRRRKSGDNRSEVDARVLLRALDDIQARAATGRLTVLTATGCRAQLYVFDGMLYAVELAGYRPPIDVRIRSGALIDSAQFDALTAAAPTSTGALRGRIAAARDWVSTEALGSIHQEFVLAALGGVLESSVVSTRFSEAVTTGDACAYPVSMDVLVEAVAIRKARMEEDWSHVLDVPSALDCIVIPLSSELPEDCHLPEFVSLVQAFDGAKSLGRAAFEGGFTLAEAVHLVSALAVRGLVRVEAGVAPSPPELWVPEAFPGFVGALEELVVDENLADAAALAEAIVVEPTAQEPIDAHGQDIDDARTHDIDTAIVEALSEELVRAESHVEAIRAQLSLIGSALADA